MSPPTPTLPREGGGRRCSVLPREVHGGYYGIVPVLAGIAAGVFFFDYLRGERISGTGYHIPPAHAPEPDALWLVLCAAACVIVFLAAWLALSFLLSRKDRRPREKARREVADTFLLFLPLALFPLKYRVGFVAPFLSNELLVFCAGMFLAQNVLFYATKQSGGLRAFLERNSIILVLGAAGIFCLTYCFLYFLRFSAMSMTWSDTGTYCKYLLSQKKYFLGADHFQPLLLAVVPFFMLFEHPLFLLFLQVVALAAGVVPVFLLAKLKLGEDLYAVLFAAFYLFYTPLTVVMFPMTYGFHPTCLSVPLLLFALYFLEKEKMTAFWVCAVVSLCVDESVSLVVAGIGVYCLLFKRAKSSGAAIVAVSIAWFFAATDVMPGFASGGLPYLHGGAWGDYGRTAPEIALNVLTHPHRVLMDLLAFRKVFYVAFLLLPAAFVPLGGWRFLLAGVPFALALLLSDWAGAYHVGTHHHAPLIPLVMAAAIDGVWRLDSRASYRGRAVAAVLVACLVTHYFHADASLVSGAFVPSRYVASAHVKGFEAVKKLVPEDATLLPTNKMGLRFFRQVEPLAYKDGGVASSLFECKNDVHEDYVVIDALDFSQASSAYIAEGINRMLADERYGLIFQDNDYWVFRKGAGGTVNRERVPVPAEGKRSLYW